MEIIFYSSGKKNKDGYQRMINCCECIFSYTDPEDDEDIYYCPFDFREAFHSLEPCHHPKAYTSMILKMRPKLNLYKHTRAAIEEVYLLDK